MKKNLCVVAILLCATILTSACSIKNAVRFNKNEERQMENELSIFSYKPDTFCPIASKNSANIRMLGIIYEGLIELNDELSPSPMLAENWTVSANALEWDLTLRSTAKWHDGSGKLSADDVVYTINQIKDLEESPYKYNVSNISEIKAVAENKVKFILQKPSANFVNLLYFPIIKRESDLKLVDFRPNGTGPYIFEDRNEGNLYYLVKNPDWWGGNVKAETIKVKMLPGGDTPLYAFGSTSLDMVPADNLDWGKSVDVMTSTYTEFQTPIYNFLGINHAGNVLSAPEIRKAISLAIDRDEIIKKTRMGYAVPANSPLRPEWFMAKTQKTEHKQNLHEAKKTVEKNDWKIDGNIYRKSIGGTSVSAEFSILINEENTTRESIARIIATTLQGFGIKANVIKVPYDEYKNRISDGNYDVFIGSMALSPDLEFSMMFGEENIFNFEDEEFYYVMDSIMAKTNPEDVKKGYEEFTNLFEQLNPSVGLFFENSVMIYTKAIKDEIKPSYFDVYRGIEAIQKGAEK